MKVSLGDLVCGRRRCGEMHALVQFDLNVIWRTDPLHYVLIFVKAGHSDLILWEMTMY